MDRSALIAKKVATPKVATELLEMQTEMNSRGCYAEAKETICQYSYEGGRLDLHIKKTTTGFVAYKTKYFAD